MPGWALLSLCRTAPLKLQGLQDKPVWSPVEGLLGSCSGEMVLGEQWGEGKESVWKEGLILNFRFPRNLWLYLSLGMNLMEVPPPADLPTLWEGLVVTAWGMLRRRMGLRCPTTSLCSSTSWHHLAHGRRLGKVGFVGDGWDLAGDKLTGT